CAFLSLPGGPSKSCSTLSRSQSKVLIGKRLQGSHTEKICLIDIAASVAGMKSEMNGEDIEPRRVEIKSVPRSSSAGWPIQAALWLEWEDDEWGCPVQAPLGRVKEYKPRWPIQIRS